VLFLQQRHIGGRLRASFDEQPQHGACTFELF